MKRIKFYYLLYLFSFANSFICNNVNIKHVNVKHINVNHINVNNKLIKINDKINIANNINMATICPNNLEFLKHLLNQENSELLIKYITSFLTKVDGFGGYVLHTNDIIINCILNNNFIDKENKKNIILFFIRLSQYGDSTGSHILQTYHDLVKCLL